MVSLPAERPSVTGQVDSRLVLARYKGGPKFFLAAIRRVGR